MPKSNTQKSDDTKVRTITVRECSLEEAKPITLGSVTWMPFPSVFQYVMKNNVNKVIKFITAKIPTRSFRVSSFYKFGGIDDASASPTYTDKKTGTKKKKSLQRREAEMMKRVDAINAGTYTGESKVRGRAPSEFLAMAVDMVRRSIHADAAWAEAFLTPFRTYAMGEEQALKNLALTVSSHGSNKVPTQKVVDSNLATLKKAVESELAREIKWNKEDNDLLEKN